MQIPGYIIDRSNIWSLIKNWNISTSGGMQLLGVYPGNMQVVLAFICKYIIKQPRKAMMFHNQDNRTSK